MSAGIAVLIFIQIMLWRSVFINLPSRNTAVEVIGIIQFSFLCFFIMKWIEELVKR